MKAKKMILAAMMFSLTLGPALAQQEAAPTEKKAVGNKICPVSGEKVGQMGETVQIEYNGKIYNLCCDMCKKDFLKNPEKYSKIAEEEVKQYEEGSEGDIEHEAGGHHHDDEH